jgi:predicted transposase/invertase (TIGR01784 family)
MKFVDIKNDIAFRKIFGNEKKKVILLSFLNAVLKLEDEQRIKSISIANPFQLPILPNMKASILDLKATDMKGNAFIIEMQVADVAGMDKRLLYYTSKEYSQQIVSGEKYTELNPVIFIGIFDFPFTDGESYYSHHAICNVETQERVIKDMDFYFIELPKFQKVVDSKSTITDKWIYFIKEAENLKMMPTHVDDDGLKEAYVDANQNSWSQEELDAYNYAAMREQDARGRIELAERKALEIGLAAGMEKGMEKGASLKESEFVIELHLDGMSLDKIARIAKVSISRVEEIIKKYQNEI